MSTLGFVSGYLEREQQLLRQLNLALLALEAEALGRANDLGFSAEEVFKGRQILEDFVARLRVALDEEITSTDFQSLVHRIKSGIKDLQDWREDLDALMSQLQNPDQFGDQALPVLEEILSLLDNEFTEDLQRLYSR